MVAPVHLEYLGTIENVAAAKAELIEGLKPKGTAILNADDRFVMKMREKHAGRTLTFGIDESGGCFRGRHRHATPGRDQFSFTNAGLEKRARSCR